MSTQLLAVIMVGSTAMVVVALFMVLWRARTSARESVVAIISGIALAVWAVTAGALASRGSLRQPDTPTIPPIGIVLAVVFVGMALALGFSGTLRRLLTNQKHLIWLNVWRLLGVVFLILMAQGQMPALWALPTGIGDIIVGVAAPWIARGLDTPGGRQRAILFNLFGMLDLIVAVGLGMMTNIGPTQVFHTKPTSVLATNFPLALVPAFLVPLAFVLHVVSLWQLLGGSWRPGLNAIEAAGKTAV
jgi:hypothetical protein